MARMIPKALPPETISSAEWRLFEALRAGLDRHWTVIHSLPWLDDTGRLLREGECDFVAMHPERGLLAIEAKSGGIRYDGPSRTWLRDGDGAVIRDPFRQAAGSAHYLNDLLGRRVPDWARLAPPFGHAVAFPEADHLPGNLPPHASPDILVLRPDLEHLQRRLESILVRYREPQACLLPEAFEAAYAALLPVFEVATPLGARIDAMESQLVRLTDDQIRVLDMTEGNRRLVIEGCAGSGKTILALEKTVRLAAAGRRVLLLCYNVPLAERLQAQLQERGARTDVFCFHDLVRHVVEQGGGAYAVPLENRQEFYDCTAIDLFYEWLPRFPRRWDAVVVDEAQDFATEWWPPVEELLADPREGVFFLFTDPGQDLFGRGAQLPFTAPVVRLDLNCRNCERIAALVGPYGRLPMRADPRAPRGTDPVVQPVATEEEEREAVRRALHDLVHAQGLRPEQIVILGRHRFEHSAFAEHPKLGGLQVIDTLEPGAPHQVRYATVWRFKGLEADVALLTGVGFDPSDARAAAHLPEAEHALLYVAGSRARHALYVYPLVAASAGRSAPDGGATLR